MAESKTIQVLIVDDHAIVREGLRSFISLEPDIVVVGEAADGVEAVEKGLVLAPDVILLDIVMPRQDGLEALRQLQLHECPARIIIITSFAEYDQIFPAIKSGAMGYLLKDSSPEMLVQAIRDVHGGRNSLHPTIATKVIEELKRDSDLPPTEAPLTEREVEVLKLVAKGLTNQEIAQSLCISERTVGSHMGNILDKLHLANRTQAALFALREGLATLDSD